MRTAIQTKNAPAAIGPYVQAVKASCGQMVFCSGQIPLDPTSGELIEGGVVEQTKQVLINLKAVLTAADCQLSDVVRTTIFLKSMDDFATVNEIYSQTFSENPPARACVEVSRLPKDVLVEIDAIAMTSA